MSADNWMVCPRCHKRHEATIAAKEKELQEAYGKLCQYDFEYLHNDLLKLKQRKLPDNLAEYRDVGLNDDGSFFAYYSAYCRECGFAFTFEHTEQMSLELQEEERR